jgi:cytochrome P450
MESLTNLRKFMKNPIALLDERRELFPAQSLQQLRIGPKNFVLVFDPKLAHEVLAERGEVFVQNRTIFDRIKPITGEEGLVQLNGKASTDGRRDFALLFAASNMIKMKEMIARNTTEALRSVQDGELDITSFMADLVLKNAFKLFLGLDLKGESLKMAEEFQELNVLCGRRMIALIPLPSRRIKKLRTSLRAKIVSALKASRSEKHTSIPDLFAFSETMIDQCMTFLFAGHETTASSLSFTFLLLGQHPQHRAAIANGDDALALRVYKESLRIFPPAYMLAREAASTCELGGQPIKKGSQVIVGVKQLHHHEGFHPRPLEFNPQRFTKPVEAFLPFGAGPKACIGEGLAYLEALTIIKIFCRTFEFSNPETSIKSYPLVTLHPAKGQRLQVRAL